jgi:RNA polymerase sigma-70 factor (ECF subfamily)
MHLAQLFAARHSTPSGADLAALDQKLAALCEVGRATWPGIALGSEQFVTWIADRVDGPDALATLEAADLWIACACGLGVDGAVAALETLFDRATRAVERISGKDGLADEAMQRVRYKLFVASPPKIASYRGDGPLAAWLRVCAVREAISMRRSREEQGRELDDSDRMASPLSDPELALLKKEHAEHFKRAFATGLAALTVRERNVLRHQIVDRLRLEDIAQMYNVHHITVARWLAKAREDLVKHTRRCLRDELRLGESTLQSVLRMVPTDLEVSVRHYFGAPDGKR